MWKDGISIPGSMGRLVSEKTDGSGVDLAVESLMGKVGED